MKDQVSTPHPARDSNKSVTSTTKQFRSERRYVRYGAPGLLASILLLHTPALFAAVAKRSTSVLADMSLEQLSDIEVTSVSKSAEVLHSAAAAIAVVSQEDIRRSGATNIPDSLRMVPGLHVAQQTNSWAMSSRGFSSINSEKLLVLSDTRSIYTPLFSGVLWDVQDYLMADIERIEVIRGPGAALWGSNAVNGVINITTKKAQDTQGTYVETAIGTEERVNAAARFGGTSTGGVSYRVFGKYFDRDDTWNTTAQSTDDWRMGHFGMRTDWEAGSADSFTVQGDIYHGTIGRLSPSIKIIGRAGPTGGLDIDASGGNILGRWSREIDADSNFVLRAYYDQTHRDDPSYHDDLKTADVDFQHQLKLTARQEFLWGVNYRVTDNNNVGTGIFNVEPHTSTDELISLFVQDQIAIFDSLQLTLGTKFEHNEFSGDEWQPSARLAWDLLPTQTVWLAVSRAVRVPTRLERDIAVEVASLSPTTIIRLDGNKKFDAEILEAYEIGYRWQARDNLAFDLAAFNNHYDGLSSLELGQPYIDARDSRTVIPIVNENLTDGDTSGIEALVTYAPLRSWRLTGSYSYLDMQLDVAGNDINRGRFLAGATPRHQFGLRSYLDLPGGVQMDIHYRYLSAIRHIPDIVDGSGISGYSEVDLRLAKRVSTQLELSLIGQNLLHDHHAEFGAPEARGEIERSVYAKAVWTF